MSCKVRPYGRYHVAWQHREEYIRKLPENFRYGGAYKRYHAAWSRHEERIREIVHKITCRVEPADPVTPHGAAVKAGKRTFFEESPVSMTYGRHHVTWQLMKAHNENFSQNCLPGRTYGRHCVTWYRHKHIRKFLTKSLAGMGMRTLLCYMDCYRKQTKGKITKMNCVSNRA
jgi:hypothetical protein